MDLYREDVMDHYEHPRNQGELSGEGVISGRESNASCGDMVQFFLKIERVKNKDKSEKSIITEVRWKGIGCAITTAAASKMSEYMLGKKVDAINMLSDEDLSKVGVGFEVNPGRMKCLMLPVKLVKKVCRSLSLGDGQD